MLSLYTYKGVSRKISRWEATKKNTEK